VKRQHSGTLTVKRIFLSRIIHFDGSSLSRRELSSEMKSFVMADTTDFGRVRRFGRFEA
jgi:hypothetical protein